MKLQMILLVSLAILGLILSASASDDSKCRELAKAKGMTEAELARVQPFRLHGVSKDSCQEVCLAKSMNVGFDYVGRQACCCAKSN